ncbi:MAG: HlyD family efflux transporter periplasmic adaptor subunit [Bacteroidia bacterium]|nr:HlyD family efflux transporter periplasmic adaptor subunit [Bacteroidia bacterium]
MLPGNIKYCNYLFIAGFILAVSACRSTTGSTEEGTVVKTPVTVVSVTFKPISETIELPAVTVFLNKNIIRSSTTGTIDTISVSPGDFVSNGQLLFTLKTREASAVRNSLPGDSSLVFIGIIKIVSPKEGVISSISHQTGDFVQEGDELAVVSEQNSLVFILEVPFELRGIVEKSNTCSLKLPDNTVITGTIKGKLPEMDVQSQAISYFVKPAATSRLPENLIAVAGIIKNSKTSAAVLPKLAILGDETQTEFWVMKVVNDSTAIKVPVRKGIENNDEVEILDPAFQSTDRVILTGNYGLPDTASVIVMK